eukprot:jgi/Astpho2/5182/fgenesh1_pg.00074_%23_16_t
MVSAAPGALIKCDIPLKQFILRLNEDKPQSEKFVIADLDDTHIFVHAKVVDELRTQIKQFQDAITYQPASAYQLTAGAGLCSSTPSGVISRAMAAETADQKRAALRQALRQLQERHLARVQAYTRLQQGFQRWLRGGSQGDYREVLVAATVEMKMLMDEVAAVEQQLRSSLGRGDLADLVAGMQAAEKEKLRMTVSLQALRKAGGEGHWSWQQDSKQQSTGVDGNDADSQHHASGMGGQGCGGHACAPALPEPTQEEYQNAVAEATQGISVSVELINENLQELRDVANNLDV